jgi:hypothetical protein
MSSFIGQQQKVEYTNRELINKIFETINNTKTLRYHLVVNERIKGKMHYSESFVKLQIAPRKLYLSIKAQGSEVLWTQGTNGGDALINPGTFPYINLNLDPFGSIMRKDQHHTIHEMGFQYLANILKEGVKFAGDKLDKYFVVLGEEKFNNRPCYKLSVAFPDFAWVPYTVKKGESIIAIARKLNLSEYMILENNPKLSSYSDVKEGQVIQVPNAYAKLTLILVDKELMLPVNTKIFDDKGLFETYEYYDLQVNTIIEPEEFTRGYKDYHF